MLKKKAAFSLSSIRLVDQRGTRLKICKLQRSYFEVYIKLELEEEWVKRLDYFEYFYAFKAVILQLSQLSELSESYTL